MDAQGGSLVNGIKLSVSSNFHNKENRGQMRVVDVSTGEKSNAWAHGAFSNATMTPPKIAMHITSGKAICISALKTNWRKSDNFVSSQLMGVDFDQSPGVEALLDDPFVHDHAFLLYPTPSHTPDAPRSRVLFALDVPITDAALYTKLLKRLMHRFQVPVDESCKDVARVFYGSDKAGWVLHEQAVLSIADLEALPPHPDELKPRLVERQATAITDYDTRKRAEKYALGAKQRIIDEALATPAGHDQRHAAFNKAAMEAIAKAKGGWPGFESIDADLRWLGQQMGRDDDEVERSIKGAWSKAEPDALVLSDRGTPAPAPYQAPEPPDFEPIEPPDFDAPPLPPTPVETPQSVIWRTSDDSMTRYRERLRRPRTDGSMPLIFPFKSLWGFGGAARIVDVGILVGIVGMSGGMKTSFLECVTEPWRQMDANDGLWWGTEWSWEKMGDRAIQRHGGAAKDQMSLHELWLIEEAQGIPPAQRNGVRLPDSVIAHSEEVSRIIESWPGKNHQMDEPITDLELLLERSGVRIDLLRAAGRKVRYYVWDYMQLLDLYSAKNEADKNTTLLGKIKLFCIEKALIGLVASQVTKNSTSVAKNGDDVLQAESGQFFRSDKFNLVLTLNPVYDGKLMTDRGVINVAKNSDGKTGLQTVFINPSRFKWMDKKVPEDQQVRREDIDDVEF